MPAKRIAGKGPPPRDRISEKKIDNWCQIDISPKEFNRLGMLHCTQSEMAAFFDCSIETIKERMRRDEFRSAYEMGMADLRVKARQKVFDKGITEGQDKALFFILKSYMGIDAAGDDSGTGAPVMHRDGLSSRQVAELRSKFLGVHKVERKVVAGGSGSD